MKFEKYIDHTLLKPESTRTQIDQIIDEAKVYNFALFIFYLLLYG